MNMKKNDCTVIGDAMVDVIFPLKKQEEINYFFEGGVTSTESKISIGGATNIATNISQLGGKSSFIGKIGNDCFGKLIKKDLKNNQVNDFLKASENQKTGVVFVVVQPSKERFFIVDRGANAYLEVSDIDVDLCLESKYLFISGYSFQDERTSKTIKKVIKEVSGNIDIIFNPGAPNLSKTYRNEFCEIIKKYVDILILNEKECEGLIGYKDIFEEFLSQVDIIALTKGEKGSIIANCEKCYEVKAYPTELIDSTGAGDAYIAGFIHGLSKGFSINNAGNLASKVAGKVVSKIGSRWWS